MTGGGSVRRECDKVLSHSRKPQSLWVWQESSAPVAPCEPLHCVCVRAGVGSGKITAPLPLPRLPGSYTTALVFVRGWFTQQKPYFLSFLFFFPATQKWKTSAAPPSFRLGSAPPPSLSALCPCLQGPSTLPPSLCPSLTWLRSIS